MFMPPENTYYPQTASDIMRGFPAPGSGAQKTGGKKITKSKPVAPREDTFFAGKSTFLPQSVSDFLRGFPIPESKNQKRGKTIPVKTQSGPIPVYTPDYSRGAAAVVQNYGQVFSNPIGAGIAYTHKLNAYNERPAEYHAGTIWFMNQTSPTSVNVQGLTSPQQLEAILGTVNILAAYPVR